MKGSSSLEVEKAKLRKELRERIKALSPEERSKRSQEILRRLFQHPRFLEAASLLTYAALETEVETRPLLEEALRRGKRVYFPRVDLNKGRIWMIEVKRAGELERGVYGILEPAFDPRRIGDPGILPLVIVPGVGFDRQGGRLGRGWGYFDRFLKEARHAYKMGLAFECQIVEKIPEGPEDVKMDEVLIG